MRNKGFLPGDSRDRGMTTEAMYIRILQELSMARFKWTGLPVTVDERYLEMVLHQQGMALFYKDEKVGRFLAVNAAGHGTNMYGNPTSFTTADNNLQRQVSSKQGVPIWHNAMRIPDWDVVYLFAKKLADVEKTIDVNLVSMRNTQLIFVDEEERHTYMQMTRQMDEGQPRIFGTRSLDPSRITTVQLGVDKDQVKNLMEVKARRWNEAMTLLGINNTNQEKKERMVGAEVEGNKDQVTAVRSIHLKARKRAAEEINRIFRKDGLNVSVDWDETATQSAQIMGMSLGIGQDDVTDKEQSI